MPEIYGVSHKMLYNVGRSVLRILLEINYSKSVAFPLHGGKMNGSDGQQVKQYVITELHMNWFDSHSTGYIKYRGYPIWFATHQRDVYTSELLE
ncbi:hypothetical protein MAM1_0190c07646 [Mucor ambiguus]|uniref:Uncharacterized protein n=1 Tax=Mucor ambiguus TaxID=91626 RepID=A0A0C9MKS3_9FUNG|nr:hypothetical protein MAM1_0190c07646 [Mucor ambiguus]